MHNSCLRWMLPLTVLLASVGGCWNPARKDLPQADSAPPSQGARQEEEAVRLACLPMIDPLGLPLILVSVAEEEYLFLVDTGATYHIIDPALQPLLGAAIQNGTAITSGEVVQVQSFQSPNLTVGGLALNDDDPVVCADLELIRLVTGHDVRGVLGIPLFRQFPIRLDWEQEEIILFAPNTAAREQWGTALEISFDDLQGPMVTADVGAKKNVAFLLDTGMNGTLTLQRSLFDSLNADGAMRRTGHEVVATASGVEERAKGRLKQIRIDKWLQHDLLAGQSSGNKLGLRYLRRFSVTFDLPNSRVYLAPSRRFGMRDHGDMSGLRLLRRSGKVVVYQVASDSPASRAGVRDGDVVVSIDHKNAQSLSMAQIRQSLATGPGRELAVALIREMGENRTVSFTLKEEPWMESNEDPQGKD